MLALFKETQHLPGKVDELCWLREKWRRSLDKGVIHTHAELEADWQIAFPEHEPELISSWVDCMSLEWIIEGISNDVREIFCHHTELIEAVGSGRQLISSPLQPEDWDLWVETLACRLKLDFNFTNPCGSAHLKFQNTEWRATLLHGSIGPTGKSKVFLRQLAVNAYPLNSFSLDSGGEDLVKALMLNRENILVAGATGSGKTSLLSSLLAEIDHDDHVVLLEDTQEISAALPRLTRMLSSKLPGRSLSDYLAHALRLSPDRIVVGEMRSHEVIPYLLAMNTGHKGLVSTLHASSAMDALLRVAQLFVLASGQKDMSYQEVLRLVSRNVGVVVFVEKRQIKQIIRVFGCDGDQPMFDVIWGVQ
jgi:type IV secretion system protein VirB11